MKILRTMGILALVAGLLLGGTGSAFAQEEEPELAEIEGVIKAVDTEAGTVTIAPEQGKAVILTVTEGTEINKDGETATIEDLVKDDEVEVLYNPGSLEAVKIVAKSPEPAENGGPAGGPPAGGPPDDRGPHSPGKRGLFGTVASVATITGGEEYLIELETKQGTFDVTADDTAKYKVPRETHGPKGLATFLGIVDENGNDDLEELVGRRVAVLVTLTSESTADAIRLMLIPSPAHHRYMHRVGVVDDFDPGSDITIIDKDGESHTFTLNGTVYRPEDISELTGDALIEAITGGCVTVVTKGDPKIPDPEAKAIVLHELPLPDWAPD
ncbi:hypothetical protein ES703_73094 [subsurface metagenome]